MEDDRPQQLVTMEERLLDAQIDEADLERREFAAESERLRAAARKHWQDLQLLETKAMAVHANETAKTNVVDTLKCEKTLHCLKRNDPETTVVDFSNYTVPEGSGKALGEALEGNTVVSELNLNGPMLLPRNCRHSSLPLVKKLLQFLSKSASLRSVYLGHSSWGDSVAFELTDMILEAISMNSRILELALNLPCLTVWLQKIADAKVPLSALTLWFPGLRRLEIPQVATCIASLTHVEYLNLFVRSDERLSIAILTQLGSSDSRLRHLRLDTESMDQPFYIALGQFLSSYTRLDHLELSGVEVYATDELGAIVRGLQHVDDETGVASIFVSRLHFAKFACSGDGFAPMAAFLKTKIHRNGAVTCRSALNELCFRSCEHSELGRHGARQLANSLLMARVRTNGSCAGTTLVPTVGSQVQSISLSHVHRIFLDRLYQHSCRVQLESLELIGIPNATGRALGACLPKLQSLKLLKLAMVGTGSPYWILHGLRQNGTLLDVEITNEEEYNNFDAAQLSLVEAYCERNAVLADLLDDESGRMQQMFPSLLQVAKQAPMTQVNNLVRGLLSSDD
jgi:hypothetical protein